MFNFCISGEYRLWLWVCDEQSFCHGVTDRQTSTTVTGMCQTLCSVSVPDFVFCICVRLCVLYLCQTLRSVSLCSVSVPDFVFCVYISLHLFTSTMYHITDIGIPHFTIKTDALTTWLRRRK